MTRTSTRRRAAGGISNGLAQADERRPAAVGGLRVSVMSSTSAVIALESVGKRYGSRTVIHDLSFTVEKGEIVGFLGPNGAGKTTTMRMIAGFTAATSGRGGVAGGRTARPNGPAPRPSRPTPEHPPRFYPPPLSSARRHHPSWAAPRHRLTERAAAGGGADEPGHAAGDRAGAGAARAAAVDRRRDRPRHPSVAERERDAHRRLSGRRAQRHRGRDRSRGGRPLGSPPPGPPPAHAQNHLPPIRPA